MPRVAANTSKPTKRSEGRQEPGTAVVPSVEVYATDTKTFEHLTSEVGV